MTVISLESLESLRAGMRDGFRRAFELPTNRVEAVRELRKRERLYPGLVRAGRMSQATSDARIEFMRAHVESFRKPKSIDHMETR